MVKNQQHLLHKINLAFEISIEIAILTTNENNFAIKPLLPI